MGHQQFVHLHDARFVVQPGGQARARREGVRNVHAFIRGLMAVPACACSVRPGDATPLSYDPFLHNAFVTAEGLTVLSASYAWLDPDGCWAAGVQLG